ncbi:MAG TPA: hypothetical protein VEX15_18530 [Nocardioidaceae bacterium]|nr:hypothetical protein [Nocardioidaceae bacterium]
MPIEIPDGVRQIEVRYSYDKPETLPGVVGNVLDIGIFDPSGAGLGNARGFRGYSGGARSSFSISRSEATPGYVEPGRWHVLLGPYTIAPQGMDWRIEVTLTFGSPGPVFEPVRAPTSVPGTGPSWYRGDLHLHTVHSDGKRLPIVGSSDAHTSEHVVGLPQTVIRAERLSTRAMLDAVRCGWRPDRPARGWRRRRRRTSRGRDRGAGGGDTVRPVRSAPSDPLGHHPRPNGRPHQPDLPRCELRTRRPAVPSVGVKLQVHP